MISRRVFEQARQRRENHPSSIEQRGRNPRLRTQGRSWSGRRSRFILSGLLTCGRCGNRFQGVTRIKGSKRKDGSSVVTRYYGCAGYITKGTKVCEGKMIPQHALEQTVIEEVLKFYRPYLEKGGRQKLAEAVARQFESEGQDVESARERAAAELERVTQIINNLLDNITETNREFVDQRLRELTQQRKRLEGRLEELDSLASSKDEVRAIATEAIEFLSGLEFTLREGVPQEKLAALRRCVERVHISGSGHESCAEVRLFEIPAGNLDATSTASTAIHL